ncbi:MAG: CHAT domain-containing protein [Chloroflexales bacterium]
MPHTTLTIHIRRLPNASFIADAELTSTATAASAQLATNAPVTLAFTELLAQRNDPATYGAMLSAQVFADQSLRDAWIKARAHAARETLQLRLRLDARADELHALRWETLCDPASGQPIALHEQVRLVRSLDSANLTPVIVPPRPALRALVIVANPSGITRFNLTPVDVKGEIARARAALGDIRPTVLGDHVSATGRATLAHIATALRDAPTIVILVAHGSIVNGVPFLWLEHADGTADRIPVATFAAAVEHLTVRPLLFVLAACTSAGTGYDETLSALGPQLASIGVPAVLCFHGEVAQETISTLLPKLLTELRRDGQIDRAMAAARAALGAQGSWWQAVLWVRTDGALWRQPSELIRGAGVFQVPYPPNPLFRGRDAELSQLVRGLLRADGGTAAVLPAITGTGGIGKTQLASEFAHRYRNDFPGGVFWLNMEQAEGIARQIANVGGPGGLDLPGWVGMPFAQQVAAVQRAWNEAVCRLLVFDNLEEPKLLQAWRPNGGGARVLVTTRRGVWTKMSGVQPVPLQTLARPESMRLLLTPRYGDQTESVLTDPLTTQEADRICDLVGDLPLALALAGAYLETTPKISLAGYRTHLAKTLLAHPSLEADIEEGLPTQYLRNVEATIALSYNQLDGSQQVDALALTLLQRTAYLAPSPIPFGLLVRLAGYDPDNEEHTVTVDKAVRRLTAVGLVELLPDEAIAIHRLISAYARQQGAKSEDIPHVIRAMTAEIRAVIETSHYQSIRLLIPHGITLIATTHDELLEGIGALHFTLGHAFLKTENFQESRSYLERALEMCRVQFGENAPQVADVLQILATTLREINDLDHAKTYVEQALHIYK